MPIQTGDIQLLESDTMSDAAEGGGAMTANVIIDGASNNIFEDISTLDRVYGAVHMRKVFPAVDIQTQDKYFGSHIIISKLPGDQKIGVNLFNTEDWFDRRPEAQSRVENYRAKGSKYSGFLWATQWKDSKVLTIFQGLSAPFPGVGDVLYLTQYSDSEFQYVKITKFAESIQEFTDGSGTFQRRILNLEISQSLEYDFIGADMSRFDTITPTCEIKNTVVANAAKYFSARPLKDPANAADLSLKVNSVYSQVIPSSLQELAVTDADAAGQTTQILDAADGTVSFQFSNNIQVNTLVYLGSPCLPGTLSIPISGGTIVDSGGQLKVDTLTIGTINYSAGTLTFGSTSPTYTGTKTITFRPAAAPVKIADTGTLAVTAANRGYVWTMTIAPPPEPGSVQVSYLALGEWYTLYDNGSGGLLGQEDGIGSGTVNYVTGTVSVTLAALPDADSEIIFTWGQRANYYNRSAITPDNVIYKFQLTQLGVARGTLVITWNDGTARTATTDNSGNITGDATGKVNHTTGLVELSPNLLPLGGTNFTMDYQFGDPLSQTFAHPIREGDSTLLINLNTADLLPNSVEVEWNVFIDETVYKETTEVIPVPVDPTVIKDDDGAGALIDVVGSVVDYVNGTVQFQPDRTVDIPLPTYGTVLVGTSLNRDPVTGESLGTLTNTYRYVLNDISYVTAAALYPNDPSGYVTIRYRVTDSETVQQDIFTADSMDIDVTPEYAEKIVPGSVRFILGTETYIDRSGSLYYDIDPVTGAGIYAGTIDYATGNMNIVNWAQGSANTITLKSLMTGIAASPVDAITFRVPSAPVKTQSLQFRVTPLDGGGEITATSDASGFITATDIAGFITYATGVVNIRFGAWVTAAGNEGEDWYDAAAVIGGLIFKPRRVHADTMLYNAVSQTFLPLDSDILGLDPVRLPQDGRIPVYSDGDVVVILHDNAKTYTPNLNEVLELSNLSVKDNNGAEVNAETYYTIDFGADTLTWAADLTGLTQPVTLSDNRLNEIAAATYTPSQVVDISSLGVAIRGRVAKLSVRDSANQEILETKYTADLDVGTITFTDVSGISFPLTITDRIEDMSVVSDVQITGKLTLSQPLTHNFPALETLVSNAVIYGDLYAHTSIPFDQETWTGVWSDILIGSEPAAQYNNSQYPIIVDNSSGIQERWAMVFISSTLVNVIGENVGQILSGVSIAGDIAPINPNTGQPYFTIPLDGWGAGWSSGNVLRFNTLGANSPVWIIQSVAQGQATDTDYNFCLEVRGDIDTP